MKNVRKAAINKACLRPIKRAGNEKLAAKKLPIVRLRARKRKERKQKMLRKRLRDSDDGIATKELWNRLETNVGAAKNDFQL
mmetsp:Transcript_22952/g.65911  ORF Transcript_22952/g.65911 Transcript_22952/m.65911 type:complete len:82 (-) Transcript_22952:769-1014(-)